MGQQLMHVEPVFRETLEEIDHIFQQVAGWSLLDELRKDEDNSRINDTVVVQPTVMAIQIALVDLYKHYDIQPVGVVGHSIGEVAAGYVAGALTLEQAVDVIYHRSQAQNRASGKGGMLAVGLTYEDAIQLIEPYGGRVSIGTVNGPEMLTLSGDSEPLAKIAEQMESQGVFNRPVKVQVAYHSYHLDCIQDEMLETLADVHGTQAARQLYSTVTAQREDGTHLNADYWFRNAREPVLFTATLQAMLDDGFDTFIEVGPHPVLVNGAEGLIQKLNVDAVVGPAMTRRQPEATVFLQSLARLSARGFKPNIHQLFGADRQFVRLPTTPWQHSRYWFETVAAKERRLGQFESPFLNRQTPMISADGLAIWETSLSVQKHPFLRDHEVDGEIVFPATGHIELTWAAAKEQFPHEPFHLENLQFNVPLIVSESSHHPLEVRLEIVSGEGDYQICSRPAEDDGQERHWVRHSSGRVNTAHDRFVPSPVTLPELEKRFRGLEEHSTDSFYEYLSVAGLTYGESFACIQQIRNDGPEWLMRLELPDSLAHESHSHNIHPALLDACLHGVFADVHRLGNPDRIYLPNRIDRVRFYRQPTQTAWARILVTRNDEHFLCSDTLLFDETGQLVAEVLGLVCKRLVGAGARQTDTVYDGCYEFQWTPSQRQAEVHGRNYDFTTAAIIVSKQLGEAETLAISTVASRLESEGIKPVLIPCGPDDSFEELLSDLHLDRRMLLVFAVGLSKGNSGWGGLSACPAVPTLLHLAQTLHKKEGVPRLCVVTNGATHVKDDKSLDLGQSILHGMTRVINNECPNVPVTLIDLSTEISASEVGSLFDELLHYRRDHDESEIALRGDERFVLQLLSVDRQSAESAATTDEPGVGGNYRAELLEPGVLDNVDFRGIPARNPNDCEVEIEVRAAGLSFRDVINAMGMLPEKAVAGGLTEQRLGYDVAGRVVRLGQSVTHVKVGDEVIARVPEAFRGRVITSGAHVVPKPKSLTAQQAATIPLSFVTAWYSCHVSRLSSGETVLIHSAAGGVGTAAIQFAKRIGAIVLATAGTKEKRDYLHDLGIEHVFDSRSLDFSNLVMDATNGRGVDVIFNSLTGRFIAQNFKCIAPFGRLVELGKSDIYRNGKLSLERLGENISMCVVDVDRLAVQKPEIHSQAMTEIAELFGQGKLWVPEITEFPISKVTDALKFMTRGAYCGKIVLRMEGERIPSLPPRQASFRPDASYLISAGASGFGLEIASWMAQRGAQHLVLLSRSGCKSDEDQAVVDGMRDLGINVVLEKADITDASAVRAAVDRIQSELPPLMGVIHGAAVMDDATIPNIDMTRFERVFQPKAQGAWNLHQATLEAGVELDFFVMMSSISSALGFIGQINYAASNYFEDALAHFRRQRGLAATSVNLGVLGEFAGLSRAVNEDQDVIGLLESYGMLAMRLSDILGKLEATIVQQPVQRMTAQVDWPWFRIAYPHLARDSRFIEVMGDEALARAFRPKGSGLRAELVELEPEAALDRLQEELQGKLAQILGADPSKLDVASSIDNLGLDSLMLTDLQIWIGRLLDITLPLIKLLKGPSIASLSAELLADLDGDDTDFDEMTTRDSGKSAFTLADIEDVTILNPWLIRGASDPDAAEFRVICFHSMGAGASLFTSFLVNPPEGYDILAVQTPGRENRADDPVVESMDELVDRIVPNLFPYLDRPVVIWGHSFGGVVAWEVTRRLREQHLFKPAHFMVTGTAGPHLMHLWQKREVLLKALVTDNSPEYIVSLSRYVDDPEFLKTIIPLMRKDYPLLGGYRFQESAQLTCPITAFAARQDDMVYTDEIRGWSQHSTGGFELIEVDGDHWFLTRNRELIIAKLLEIAAAYKRIAPPQMEPVELGAE